MTINPNVLIGVSKAAFFGSQKGKPQEELRKASDLTQEERAYWVNVAESVLDALHWEALKPGRTSTLFGSKGFPDTRVEVVSTRHPTLVTIKIPNGSTHEVEQVALLDWSSDWNESTTERQYLSPHRHVFKPTSPTPYHRGNLGRW